MKMTLLLMLVLIVVVVAAVFIAMKSLPKDRAGKATERPKQKRLLSEREQSMHNRLTQALPDLIVLAQVSLGAMLSARAYAVRNTFDRKIADFVICDKAFHVLAVIELDDASHKEKSRQDGERDALLTGAGYRVVRYSNIPDIERVQADFPSTDIALPTTKPAQKGTGKPAPPDFEDTKPE